MTCWSEAVAFTFLLGICSRYFILHYYSVDVVTDIFNNLSLSYYALLALAKPAISLCLEELGLKPIKLAMDNSTTQPGPSRGGGGSSRGGPSRGGSGPSRGGSGPGGSGVIASNEELLQIKSSYDANKKDILYITRGIKRRMDDVKELHEDTNTNPQERTTCYEGLLNSSDQLGELLESRDKILEQARNATGGSLKYIWKNSSPSNQIMAHDTHSEAKELLGKYDYLYTKVD